MNQPTISIITVAYNNLKGLKKTVDNIRQLTHADFEHVIVDGLSTDGSIDYLNTLEIKNTKWVSEKDNGIYDAMNKGIKMCNGNWIIFMNAGDIFNSNSILTEIKLPQEPAILYGNSMVSYETGFSRLMVAKPLNSIWKGLPFSHQSVLMHKDLISTGFNLSLKYCADFEILYQLFLSNIPVTNTELTIANITAGGISDSKRYLATKEVYNIGQKLKPQLKLHIYFIPKIIISFFVVKLKVMLPKSWQHKLYKAKYK